MEWKGRRGSRNIEDRRGSSVGRTAGIGGLGAVVLLLISLFLGVDVSPLLQGTGATPGRPVEVTAEDRAAGEFVSVHSQKDTENADLARERTELTTDPVGERRELAGIYVGRGLDPSLADQVAGELMAHDALGAHARDELGLSDTTAARPIQAAWASAASFSVGAVLPIAVVLLAPPAQLLVWVSASSLVFP